MSIFQHFLEITCSLFCIFTISLTKLPFKLRYWIVIAPQTEISFAPVCFLVVTSFWKFSFRTTVSLFCAKFRNDLTNEMDLMDALYFARIVFDMNFRGISFLQQPDGQWSAVPVQKNVIWLACSFVQRVWDYALFKEYLNPRLQRDGEGHIGYCAETLLATILKTRFLSERNLLLGVCRTAFCHILILWPLDDRGIWGLVRWRWSHCLIW